MKKAMAGALAKAEVQRDVVRWIARILDQKKLNATDLARRAELQPSTISRLLNDPHYRFLPRMQTLAKIATASGGELPASLRDAYDAIGASKMQSTRKPAHVASNPADRSGVSRPGASYGMTLHSDGQMNLPAPIRAELGLDRGGRLIGRVRDGALVIEPAGTALRRAQALVRRFIPAGVSLVDELIAERRAEAEYE